MAVDPQYIRAQIDAVRGEIGRDITFHTSSLTPCVLCTASGYYDATNDTTTYFTCPVCAGQFYMPETTETIINARVHWVSDEQITATPGGKHFIGECYVHIEPEYLSLAESAQTEAGKVVVDGHDMSITKILPQGAASLNRYRLVLKGFGQRPE